MPHDGRSRRRAQDHLPLGQRPLDPAGPSELRLRGVRRRQARAAGAEGPGLPVRAAGGLRGPRPVRPLARLRGAEAGGRPLPRRRPARLVEAAAERSARPRALHRRQAPQGQRGLLQLRLADGRARPGRQDGEEDRRHARARALPAGHVQPALAARAAPGAAVLRQHRRALQGRAGEQAAWPRGLPRRGQALLLGRQALLGPAGSIPPDEGLVAAGPWRLRGGPGRRDGRAAEHGLHPRQHGQPRLRQPRDQARPRPEGLMGAGPGSLRLAERHLR
mmetsp:Transcript_94976/g.245328  ORF Transcript_94976/g.245328 Transcript_94976/m.245328 type:complete len:276 (-) Transcript_94976:595-1422(-)